MSQTHSPSLSNKALLSWLNSQSASGLLVPFLTLFDNEAFYVLDSQQQVLYWSLGVEQLTGLNADDVVGKPCVSIYSVKDDAIDNSYLINITMPEGSTTQVRQFVEVLKDDTSGINAYVVRLTQTVKNSFSSTQLESSSDSFQGLISRSPAMQAVFQIIENAAETTATVLVRGESGSGKELVAKAIHDLSGRRSAPFLAINCAALSSSLLESELFGHVRGAFTGAIKDHHGLFHRAQGGTLFLDEVAELPLELQAKLLRVIQERNYIPVGGDKSISVDVRIVAATHRSLREEVKQGHFREDLMYRLRVVPIFLPPLRERREDIGLLLWHFIKLHNADNFRHIEKIEPQAMRTLLDYSWPGNIRELHNVVEYAFAVGRGTVLRSSELPPEFREPKPINVGYAVKPSFYQPLSPDQEREAIKKALETTYGRVSPAAAIVGMSRATFWRKRKLYGV